MNYSDIKKVGYGLLGIGFLIFSLTFPPMLIIAGIYLIYKKDIDSWFKGGNS